MLSPAAIHSALQAIEQHQRILILPHANIDPDALSSALACQLLFRTLGKETTVVCAEDPPASLSFLPGFGSIQREIRESEEFVITINLNEGVEVDKLRYTVEDHRVHVIVAPKKGRIRSDHITLAEGEKSYDLIVVVDTADLPLLGSSYTGHIDLFSSVPILNLDHHISNTHFGQLHLIDPTAASATEVIYAFCSQAPVLRDRITPDVATLLLAGLITDTRSFQNPNTTPRSLEIAAELLERGARQQDIIQHVYKTKPLSTLKIWGRALNRIQVDPSARIVWSSISKEDLAEMDSKSSETHGILDELISTIPDADVYVLFTELEEGGLKASLRSSAAVDVSRLAGQTFGGGGHPRAAGFRVREFSNFALQVLACVQTLQETVARWREEESRSLPSQPPLPEPRAVPQNERKEKKSASAPALSKPSADVVQRLTPVPKAGEGNGDVVGELMK